MRFLVSIYHCDKTIISIERSGWNYLMLVINIAYDIEALGGDGEYTFFDHSWKPNVFLQAPFSYRTPLSREQREKMKSKKHYTLYHLHALPNTNMPMKLHLKKMQGVLLIRNIFDQALSSLFYHGYAISQQKEFVSGTRVDHTIRYYNEWGKFFEKNSGFVAVKYEELIEDAFHTIKTVSEHLDIGLTDSSIIRALALSTKEEMFKRMTSEELKDSERVNKRPDSVRFSAESLSTLYDRIKKEVRYDFGYDFGKLYKEKCDQIDG
ncbi:MAG: sulfotransferase domain-containing protein [Phycisphaerae bacterium]|nr:sulfotransferase domain-containing protein [Phycisphaerae bacterium]